MAHIIRNSIKEYLTMVLFVLIVQYPFIVYDILSFEALLLWGLMVIATFQRWQYVMSIGKKVSELEKLQNMMQKPKGRWEQ